MNPCIMVTNVSHLAVFMCCSYCLHKYGI